MDYTDEVRGYAPWENGHQGSFAVSQLVDCVFGIRSMREWFLLIYMEHNGMGITWF